MSAEQVLIDDFIDILLINIAVPDRFRIHDHDRPLLAAIQTAGLVDANFAGAGHAERLDALLAVVPDPAGAMILATSLATVALVTAEENMTLVVTHDRLKQRLTTYYRSAVTPVSPNFPLIDADLCVKCGLCLPHCPTYRLTQNEGDSPRGRIALMQGLATGLVPPSLRLEAHLDGCLACRACEVVCPAEVPYGRLIDAGRELLTHHQPARIRLVDWLGTVLTRASLRRGLGRVLWFYQASGVQGLLRRWRLLGSSRLARLESLLPLLAWPKRLKNIYPAVGPAQGEVALFTGCVSELAERQVLDDSISLLTRLGYRVKVPRTQTCCGALHQHNGRPQRAQQLARENCAAFADTSTDQAASPILGTASGCTANLKEYDELLGSDSQAAAFALRISDICTFLLDARGWENLIFRPLPQTVAVHEPCTLRNVLKASRAAYTLLEKIPELRVLALADNTRCCGAAGSYFLSEPEMADRLVADKLSAIEAMAPDWLISSNVGCALHIRAALHRQECDRRRDLPLLHPVSLLVRQLALA